MIYLTFKVLFRTKKETTGCTVMHMKEEEIRYREKDAKFADSHGNDVGREVNC